MRRMRVIMGLLLAVVLLLGVAVPAMAAAEFTDIEDHDYEASILNLATRGFIGGYADGTFRPDNTLQRQQFAKMADLTLGYEVTAADQSTFKDTPAPFDPVNNPLYPGSYVAVAAAEGIIRGYTRRQLRLLRQRDPAAGHHHRRARGRHGAGRSSGRLRGRPRLLQPRPRRQRQEG